MIKVTTPEIIAFLRLHPEGISGRDICTHFGVTQLSLPSRLGKLAAYGIIRIEVTSRCVNAVGKTTGAQTRRYFPPRPALQAAE